MSSNVTFPAPANEQVCVSVPQGKTVSVTVGDPKPKANFSDWAVDKMSSASSFMHAQQAAGNFITNGVLHTRDAKLAADVHGFHTFLTLTETTQGRGVSDDVLHYAASQGAQAATEKMIKRRGAAEVAETAATAARYAALEKGVAVETAETIAKTVGNTTAETAKVAKRFTTMSAATAVGRFVPVLNWSVAAIDVTMAVSTFRSDASVAKKALMTASAAASVAVAVAPLVLPAAGALIVASFAVPVAAVVPALAALALGASVLANLF